MKQTALFPEDIAITTDMFVLLQVFTNYRDIDIAQDFHGLSHVYHSVYTHPDKLPKTSWSTERVMRAIEKCEEADLIAYGETITGHKWTITEKGIAVRRAAFQVKRRGETSS